MGKLFFETALLPQGWARNVLVDIDKAGVIASVKTGRQPGAATEHHAIGLPGLPNLHSHAFQRGMAGLAEVAGPSRDSFWTWRQVMYRFLERLGPEEVEAIAAQLYAEMLEAGFTSVAEFHYLHHAADGTWYADPAEMAGRIAAAARQTGIGLTLLPVLYAHGGFGGKPVQDQQRRFASTTFTFPKLVEGARHHVRDLSHAAVGIAPHSLRAVTPEELTEAIAAHHEGPVHIHVAEQMREVEDCLDWSGKRPVQWLMEHSTPDNRWCLIHATHMTQSETLALVRSGAVAGLCPITEANLGDGLFDGVRYMEAGGRLGVGSDSHVRVDAAEELRLLEYGQRLRDRSRNVFTREGQSTGRFLYGAALRGGGQALSRNCGALEAGRIADVISLDAAHAALVAREGDRLLDAWLFSGDGRCVGDVWVAGRKVVAEGRHVARDAIRRAFTKAMGRVLS